MAFKLVDGALMGTTGEFHKPGKRLRHKFGLFHDSEKRPGPKGSPGEVRPLQSYGYDSYRSHDSYGRRLY